VYFSQAIPLVAYIDESCLYLKEKKCLSAKGVCQADAIDLQAKPEKNGSQCGAIILSSGMNPLIPKVDEYGYGEVQNVVTSMDYERLLCATGPYGGEVLRGFRPETSPKIAWIQCVGSRRVTEGRTAIVRGSAAPMPRNR
jgi:heterodisulfide reductase subunit A